MIERIILKNVLPAVFAGAENEPPVCDSQVWLRDVTFEWTALSGGGGVGYR